VAESVKVNAVKILKYTIAIGIFLILVELLARHRGLTTAGIETIVAMQIGLAGTILSIVYLVTKKEPMTQRKLALGMLWVNLIVTFVCLAIYIALMILNMTTSFDLVSLIVQCVAVTIIGYAFSILSMISIIELIGKSRIMKLETAIGKSRSENIRIRWSHIGHFWKEYSKSRVGTIALAILVIISVIAIIGPFVAPQDPHLPQPVLSLTPQPPSEKYLMGTDFEDKDVFSQFLIGGMPVLIVSFVAGTMSTVIGALTGVIAGYYGRKSEEVIMRTTDFFLVLPWLPFMIVLIALLGRSFGIVIIVIGIVSWPSMTRLIRAQVLSVKEKMYIERSRAFGASDLYIIRRHILPNVFPLVVVNSIFMISGAIFSVAFLDFFGLGNPNTISWGWMLERAQEHSAMVNLYWWWITPPAVGIVLLIMCFYLIGDTIDGVWNPRLKRR